jgi:hypothetical protein
LPTAAGLAPRETRVPRAPVRTGLDSRGSAPVEMDQDDRNVANPIVPSGGAQMMKALVGDEPSSRALCRCAHICAVVAF